MVKDACPLPYGLHCLLKSSDVFSKYPSIAFFSAYIPGETDALGAGISRLVTYRLFNPDVPVLFLSFHAIEDLRIKDSFGVLDLPGVAFLRLPCSGEEIMNTAASVSTFKKNESIRIWKSFAEKTSKTLIRERISVLKHGNRLFLGDILYPLRANCRGMQTTPRLKDQYLNAANQCLQKCNNFLAVPEIKELIQFCTIDLESEDIYLRNALSFAGDIKELSSISIDKRMDVNNLIGLIDSINKTYKTIIS